MSTMNSRTSKNIANDIPSQRDSAPPIEEQRSKAWKNGLYLLYNILKIGILKGERECNKNLRMDYN